MKRSWHTLTRNEANTRPQYMIFVDTETYIKRVDDKITEYPFRLGVAHFWRRRRDGGNHNHEWFEFTDPTQFWDWLERHTYSNSVTYLIAHNILFDLVTLNWMEELSERGWECTFAYAGNHTSLYKYRRDGRTLHCVDNCNIFRGGLDKWAEAIGMPKVEINFAQATDAELWQRCARDVAIMVNLWSWWLDFLDEHDMGIFKPTIAAQAIQAYRHRFMHHKIVIHNHKEALKLERAAYRGGRTEPFFVGKATNGPYYKLDVNSMYPYVMKKYEYPAIFNRYDEGLAISTLEKCIQHYGYIADVTVDVDEPWYPVNRDGRNVYPIGEFRTVLTTEELKLALERGWLKEIHKYARYIMKPLFVDFVDYLYPLKVQYDEEGILVLRELIKLLLNSLHGKFGQRGMSWKVIGKCDPHENDIIYTINAQTLEQSVIRCLNGKVMEARKETNSFNAFPAIAAHVSANARLELYRLVKEAGDRNCLYCDTDCLIVNNDGLWNVLVHVHSTELGKLKIEDIEDEVEIRGPKDYTFGSTQVVKGIPKGAKWLSGDSAEVELWPSLNTYLKERQNRPYFTIRITRTLSRRVNHGHVGEDGWVRPFKYPEDKE